MELITIGFSYNKNSIISKGIQLAEGSEYSHVYIRRKSKYGEYVYQASGLVVNFMNIDIFLKHNVPVEEYEFELSEDQKEKLISFFIKYAGCGYEIASLFKLMTIIIGRRINMKFKFKGDGETINSKFICSELTSFFCEEILQIPIDGDLDMVTPLDFHNQLIRSNPTRIL